MKENRNKRFNENSELNISDVINSVFTENEKRSDENYGVLKYDGDKNECKLLEIATSLPRALYLRDSFREDVEDDKKEDILVIKFLDDDILIQDEINRVVK